MKIVLSVLSLILLKGIFIGFFNGAVSLLGNSEIFTPFLIGLAISGVAHYLLIKKLPIISTFEHELTHAIVALLFFRKVSNFIVTNGQGGSVSHSGKFGGKFGSLNITLAPYFLPTFTFIIVLFRPQIPIEYIMWFDIFISFTFGYHLFSTIDEIKINWTKVSFKSAKSNDLTKSDIAKSGYIFSFIYILTLTTLIHGIIIWIWLDDYNGIINYFTTIYNSSKTLVTQIVALVSEYWSVLFNK
jgi:hypothetical protein